ncbi:MAG: aminotransferase class I/II-fold pyridoxal phosphate-dependent enzyme [Aquificaceae bacterium]|nr:aminotransferase class I/II-fold pyridoxal phosphate-dependent enzyme [Aquificaceae bacterium]
MFELANRINALPPYLFAQIDSLKRQKLSEGADVIDLGVGDPDLPTPQEIVEAMISAVKNPVHHRYPSYEGMPEFREAVAKYYQERFGVKLDPEKEVLTLIGSKEGIAHLPLGLLNQGDVVLCPDPSYPPYKNGAIFAGAEVYSLPLKWENSFLPKLEDIPQDILNRAKLIWVNYPNNPTSAGASLEFYSKLVEFAKKHSLAVASDLAYAEIYTGSSRPSSILQIDGAKDVAIEFYSFSKTFNMAGWRLGAAVGNKDLIKALGKVKTNIDSGQFQAIQKPALKPSACLRMSLRK